MSIFFCFIIAAVAAAETFLSLLSVSSVSRRGKTCQDTPKRSFSQPQTLSSPPSAVKAAQSRSVSAWSSVAIWKENASVGRKTGPPRWRA